VKSLISKEKKMIKGYNLMDLAFFILEMYMSGKPCPVVAICIGPQTFLLASASGYC
jgi:hypothetical protein